MQQTAEQMQSNRDMFNNCPSIFHNEKKEDRSDYYIHIPTYPIIQEFQNRGFKIRSAKQIGKKVTATHTVRLSYQDKALKVGDSIPELVLRNSHDGACTFSLMLGIFRLVCSNGMLVADSTLGSINQKHRAFQIEDIEQACREFLLKAEKLDEKVKQFQSIELDIPQCREFAEQAGRARFSTADIADTMINHRRGAIINNLLTPRREQDKPNTLWHTLNRVQENLIKGGFVLPGKNRKVRQIKGINADMNINLHVWDIAERFAQKYSAN